MLGAALLPAGTADNNAVVARLRRVYESRWATQPLFASAVRLTDGSRVWFGTLRAPVTDVPTAVAASCAVPGVWAPVVVDGVRYIDGGAHSPNNADVLAAPRYGAGLDLVVVSSPASVGRGAGLRPDLPVRLALRRGLAAEIAELRAGGTAVVAFQPTGADCTSWAKTRWSAHAPPPWSARRIERPRIGWPAAGGQPARCGCCAARCGFDGSATQRSRLRPA